MAIELPAGTKLALAAIFFVLGAIFVYRSFYGMRITAAPVESSVAAKPAAAAAARGVQVDVER
jgi:hypothetical protein